MKTLAFSLLAIASVGCAGVERTEAEWQDDTAKALQSHEATIKGCYEQALTDNPELEGRLIIKFNVADRSGKVKSVRFDGNSTVGNQGMERCIERVLEKHTFDPADKNNAKATVMIDFKNTTVKETSDKPQKPQS